MAGTLSLAVGANVAIFSLANALWISPAPFDDRAVLTIESSVNTSDGNNTRSELQTLRQFQTLSRAMSLRAAAAEVVFTGHAGDARPRITLGRDGGNLQTSVVSHQFFETLGVALRGPGFGEDDDHPGAPPSAVLSDALWRAAFGADPGVVGQYVQFGGLPVVVRGVVAGEFRGVRIGERIDVWLSLASLPRLAPTPAALMGMLPVRSYLRPASDVPAARLEGSATTILQRRVELLSLRTARYPLAMRGSEMEDRRIVKLTGLLGLVVLLLGALNMAHLAASRVAERATELDLRVSLGATRRSITRLLLIEITWIAAIGALAAVLVSRALLVLMSALTLPSGVAVGDLGITRGWGEWLTAFILGLLVLVAAAAPPALAQLARGRIRLFHGEQQPVPAGRPILIGIHVAISLVLLTVSGLFVQTVRQTLARSYGFDTRGTLALVLQPRVMQYAEAGGGLDFPRRVQDFKLLVEGLEGLPGVTAVTTGPLPLLRPDGTTVTMTFSDGARRKDVAVQRLLVGAGYLSAAGIPILRGRDLQEADVIDSPVATPVVMSETLAARLGEGREVLGATFDIDGGLRVKVVGIAADAIRALREPIAPAYFVPYSASGEHGAVQVLVRARVPAESLVAAARRVALDIFPDPARLDVRTTRGEMLVQIAGERFGAAVFSGFGVTALCLSFLGVYGLTSALAQRRRREWAIRVAVGAARRDVLLLAARGAAIPVAAGVAAGIAPALWAAAIVRARLIDSGQLPVATLAIAMIALVAVGVTASGIAARNVIDGDISQVMRTL